MRDLGKRLRFLGAFMLKRLVHLNLQILYQCNFSCSICDFWKEPYKSMPMISVPDVEVMAGKLRKTGPLIISIGGGEPLLHPRVMDIIKVLAERHFPVMICNGWFVTEDLARSLFRAGLYEISISLDYANPARHDLQRGMPGAFDRALRALEILNRSRLYTDQRVHMISVIMDDNLEEIEPLIKIAKEMGITYLVTLYSHARGSKAPRVSVRDLGAMLISLKKKHPNFVGIRGYLSHFTEAASNGVGVLPCYAGKNLFNIDSQGNVTPCIDRLDRIAGNILSDDFERIKRELLKQFYSNDCGQCWTSCRGNIETLMYGKGRILNFLDSYKVTKSIPLFRTG